MAKILVVYFSRTGFTQRVAEDIAARCGADIEGIRDVRNRQGILGYLRSVSEALKQRVIEIGKPARNPADYDTVIIGTPVWASHLSSPVRAYVTSHLGQFRRVAFFCTQGGSGAPKVLDELSRLCRLKPAATLFVNDAEIKAGRHVDGVVRFLGEVAGGA